MTFAGEEVGSSLFLSRVSPSGGVPFRAATKMFSLSSEDDDGTFGGTVGGGSSKLASLFGHDKASFSGGNESLKYTAPKQPRKDKPGGQQGEAPAVVASAAIHAYRFIDNQYVNQGKLGAAVLANHSAGDYKILIYAGKQQHVAIARIHSQFVFTVQANNYASFCDDQRQRWSVCFDSEKNAVEFTKQVGLAIFNTQPSALFTQDLTLGDGQPIEIGDAVECKYTGWLWTNKTFGKVFDSNAEKDKTFKFRTGKGKVIKGWDQGVIGMKKGGKRFIGIPTTLAYGEKGVGGGKVPPNAVLLFQVEILKIKSKDGVDSGGSKSSSRTESPVTISESKDTTQMASLPNITSEPSGMQKSRSESSASIKGRTASISEQLSQSPDKGSDKARLLARMSKMGKNVLTIPGAVAAGTEGEEEETSVTEEALSEDGEPVQETPVPVSPTQQENPTYEHTHPNPKPNPRPKPHVPQRPTPVQPNPEVYHNQTSQPISSQQAYTNQAQQLALYQNPQGMPMNYSMMPPPQYYQQAPFPAQTFPQPQTQPQAPLAPQPSANDAMVPVLMAETRQQQSEVRMAIGKVSEKVDDLLHKFERFQLGSGPLVPASSAHMPSANTETMMESSVLLHNITRIVQENEKLKKDNTEKTVKIETLNEKISELLQKNQKFLEKSNVMMEQSSDSLQHTSAQNQARVLALEQEKISRAAELSELKTRVAETDGQLSSLRKQESELKSQVNKALASANKYKDELDHVKELHEEELSLAARLKQDLKEEKQTRKRFESRADHMEEELSDLTHEKESLEKSISERKKKQTHDRRKFEEELEELKNQHEEEIRALKERHRREKRSGDASAEQVAELEREIEARWTEKAAKMVAQSEEKWKRRYEDALEEKEEVTKKLESLEEKYSGIKGLENEKDEQLKHLQTRIDDLMSDQEKITSSKNERDEEIILLKAAIDELKTSESKYQETRARAVKMKEEYDKQISTAEKEHESAVSLSYKRGFEDGKLQGPSESIMGSQTLANEVKKIMNNVFYMLKSEFDAGTTYTGTDIMSVVLRVVKDVTLKQVNVKSDEGVEQEEEDKEEEDEEEEEEDEDDDEEEEEEQQKEGEKEQEDEEENEEQQSVDQDDQESEDASNVQQNGEEDTRKSEKESHPVSDNTEPFQKEKDIYPETPVQSTTDNVNHDSNDIQSNTSEVAADEQVDARPRSEDPVSIEELPSSDVKTNEDIESIDTDKTTGENNREEQKDIETQPVTSKTDYSDESENDNEGPPPLDEENTVSEPSNGKEVHEAETRQQPAMSQGNQNISAHKPLFGDDDHDDVAATFGPLKRKPDLTDESTSKPMPPPLFDNDEDDNLDWFK